MKIARRKLARPKNVTVIINPSAGQAEPVLHPINNELAEFNWKAQVTTGAGDARKFAKEAVLSGSDLIIAYGGDGTLIEIVDGVVDSDIPILVLRGGTGNVIADELDLPVTIEESLAIIKQDQIALKAVDLGLINQTNHFILRCGCGLEAQALVRTNNAAKSNWGKAAYIQGFLLALSESDTIDFSVWIDDEPEPILEQGVLLTVANAGRIGWGDLRINPDTKVSDGLLDICIIKSAGIGSALEFLKIANAESGTVDTGDLTSSSLVVHQQASKIKIETSQPVTFQADGDLMGNTPLEIEVVPRAAWFVTG